MSNFQIEFTYPWLLLLLIPAVVLTLFPYFRLAKRYRRTRNRVTSVVLHLIVMVLSIFALSGVSFSYDLVNESNEIILLVDVSDSSEDVAENRNDFVKDVIGANDGSIKLGIVTFGYSQVYAVEMTDQLDDAYNIYLDSLESNPPDVTATDISSALTYATSLFSENAIGKIVLVSDGLETDNQANSVIKSIAAEGYKVDTSYISSSFDDDEVQVIGVTLPEGNIRVGDNVSVSVTLQSSVATTTELNTITVYDQCNGTETQGESIYFKLSEGTQDVTITHSFSLPGLHTLRFAITTQAGDVLNQNNTYYSYYDLQLYDQILIVHRENSDPSQLVSILGFRDYDDVTTVSVDNTELLPDTVDELRLYDEVILMNVSNADMPEGFIDILQSYVYDYGGGLLTVGGTDENGDANMYNREDLYNTTYQSMLPVEAIDYTPPLGVIFVLDTSGSMTSILEAAKSAISDALQVMSTRDYCGIVTLSDSYSEEVQMLPMSQIAKIYEAINNIEKANGGTLFSPAITYAARALYNNSNISKRHIVLITDGQPSSSDQENYLAALEYAYNAQGVTTTIVTIGADASAQANMITAAKAGQGDRNMEGTNGEDYYYYNVSKDDSDTLGDIFRVDLTMPEIKDMVYETFYPTIADSSSTIVTGIEQRDVPSLGGFYGTKIKTDASLILTGEYDVPIYAQWQYGAGMVGSFMCDLEMSEWSSNFMSNETGQRLIANIVGALLPTTDIDPQDIAVAMTENNYSTQLSIYTELEETQTVEVTVTSMAIDSDGTSTLYTPSAASGFSRVVLNITEPGVYRIVVEKKNADGTVYSSLTVYKAFSYSEEYNYFRDPEEGRTLMTELADSGRGIVVDERDAVAVYDSFVKTLHRTYDPRLALLITALVLFLLDIAVRKFKWKWIHEIVRDKRQKRELEKR